MQPKMDSGGKETKTDQDSLSKMLELIVAIKEQSWKEPILVPQPHIRLKEEFKDEMETAKLCEFSVRTGDILQYKAKFSLSLQDFSTDDAKILANADEIVPVQFPLRMFPKKFDKVGFLHTRTSYG